MPNTSYSIGRCVASMDGDESWEILRIGPFSTTGGGDWTKMDSCQPGNPAYTEDESAACLKDLDENFPGFGKQWSWAKHEPRVVAVSMLYQSAVDMHGKLIGYPPIHPHHSHIEASSSLLEGGQGFAQGTTDRPTKMIVDDINPFGIHYKGGLPGMLTTRRRPVPGLDGWRQLRHPAREPGLRDDDAAAGLRHSGIQRRARG